MFRRAGQKLVQAKLAKELANATSGSVPGSHRCLSSALLSRGGTFETQSSGFGGSNDHEQSSFLHMRGFSAGAVVHSPAKTYDEDGIIQEPSSEDLAAASSADGLGSSGADDLMGPDAISHVINSAELGALAEAWDEGWFLNKGFQYLIQNVHYLTGTPWWQSIAMTTVLCRVMTFPLVVKQMHNTANMTKAKPDLEALAAWFKEKSAEGRAQQYQQEYMTRMALIWKKHDSNPGKSFLPIIIQAPIFIGFFGALRTMAAAKIPSLTTGGLDYAWLRDLTATDPYYIMPILSSLIFLITIELNAADGMQGQDPQTVSRMKNAMRVVAVIMIPATASMPLSVFSYWITSNIYSLIQGSVLKLKSVRKLLKLPALAQTGTGKAVSAKSLAAAAAGQPVQSFSSKLPTTLPSKPVKVAAKTADQGPNLHRQKRRHRRK